MDKKEVYTTVLAAQETKLQEFTASGLLDRWLEMEEMSSVCAVKNNVGNVVSDDDGMNNIWRKYVEKLLNVENDWDGEVDCPEVMGPCCLISE